MTTYGSFDTTRRYAAQYPRLWEATGPKCEHAQYRTGGRIPLYCARPLGHGSRDGKGGIFDPIATHLHDVHPLMQVGPLGDAARAARELDNVARYGDAETRVAKLDELSAGVAEAHAIVVELGTALNALSAAGATDLVAMVRARHDAAKARRDAASGKLIAYRTNLQGRDHKLAAKFNDGKACPGCGAFNVPPEARREDRHDAADHSK